MGSKNPVTDAERERVRELHAAGKGRNEIAKILGRGGRTISDIAQSLGLSFGRAAQVQQATEIRTADLAARRAATAQRLQDVANANWRSSTSPTHTSIGAARITISTPMGVVATDLDRSLKLAPPKEGGRRRPGRIAPHQPVRPAPRPAWGPLSSGHPRRTRPALPGASAGHRPKLAALATLGWNRGQRDEGRVSRARPTRGLKVKAAHGKGALNAAGRGTHQNHGTSPRAMPRWVWHRHGSRRRT
ncbi:hypothetical protein ACGFWD_41270 [Streptomyces sp. NPDC048448]|uniref:hypothetical protein n=1 Tax=Streptomyces sp. NPDC048448 TaxID=3365554 RepID=UPI00371D14D0